MSTQTQVNQPGIPAGATGLVWIDGEVGPIEGARVPLEDRGFLFADGVYEVIKAYGGHLFALGDHLARLERSAAGIRLELPMSVQAMGAIALDLLQQTGLADAEIYVELTRGAARRNHVFPAGVAPRLVIWARQLRDADPDQWTRGVRAITLPDERWARCDIKAVALLPNVLAKQKAYEAGAFEALLVRDGLVMEGSASNVFLVKGRTLIAPVADRRILGGVTRARILQLAETLGVPVGVRDVEVAELASADEAFLTSTLLEVLPVTLIDGVAVGSGVPGPVTKALMAALGEQARSGLH